MNNGLQPVSSNVNGETFLNHAWQRTGQLATHVIEYVRNIPTEMNHSPIAAITVIAIVNIPLCLAAHYLINHIDSRWDGLTNPTNKKERTFRHICAREFLAGSAVLSCNLLLATLTKVQLTSSSIVIMGVASGIFVAIRLFQNREKAVTAPHKTKEMTPELELANLRAQAGTAAKEKKRADDLTTEKGQLEIQVTALGEDNDRLTKELRAAQGDLKASTTQTGKEITALRDTIAALQKEKQGVEAERKQAKDRIAHLDGQLKETSAAKKAAESSLAQFKTEMERHREASGGKFDELTLATSSAQTEIASLKHQLTQATLIARREIEQKQREIAELQQANKLAEGNLASAQKTIEKNIQGADATFTELNAKIDTLQKEKEAIAKKHDEAIGAIQAKLDRASAELKENAAEIKRIQAASKLVSGEKEALDKKYLELIAVKEELDAEIVWLNKKIDAKNELLKIAQERNEDGVVAPSAVSTKNPISPVRVTAVAGASEAKAPSSAERRKAKFLNQFKKAEKK